VQKGEAIENEYKQQPGLFRLRAIAIWECWCYCPPWCASPTRQLPGEMKSDLRHPLLIEGNPEPQPTFADRGPGLAIFRYPFTGMVAGLASLNVNLLLAASRVTSLFALDLSAFLALLLGWLFGPVIELESSG
jgi:hypothetical protein